MSNYGDDRLYAQTLFDQMREAGLATCRRDPVPSCRRRAGSGLAVRDRLLRAAGSNDRQGEDRTMSKEQAEKRAKALDWLKSLRREHPAMSKLEAIEKTAVRFNLSPLEEEWLLQQLTDSKLAPKPPPE